MSTWVGLCGLAGMNSEKTEAAELSVTSSWVEQTDSRLNFSPGLSLYRPEWDLGVQIQYWGQTFHFVTEHSVLASLYHKFMPLQLLDLSGKLGGSLVYETTRISVHGDNTVGSTYGLGVLLGVDLTLYRYKNWALHSYWESTLIPAGLLIMLGVTARKQFFGLRFSYIITSSAEAATRDSPSPEPSSASHAPKFRPALFDALLRSRSSQP